MKKYRPEGEPYIWGSFVASLLFGLLGIHIFAILALAVTLLMLTFFRDPERRIVYEPTLILSPADGKVTAVEKKDDKWHISIFMSIFDCHVNRAPVTGTVIRIVDHGKGYRPAFNPEAGKNVAKTTIIETNWGNIELTQITGLLARRIVLWIKEGDRVEAGDRIGMIMFGSRVDLKFSGDWEIFVKKGMRVKAGESIIGRKLT